MQVILSEAEYNNLKYKEKLYEDIIKQVEECFEITYNDDKTTVKGFSINIDKVIELGNSEVNRAAKETGTIEYMSKQKSKTLKSVDRINRTIDEGRIKRIFVFDGWYGFFAKKIDELFGNKVEVYTIKNSIKSVEGIKFNDSDCILFYETIIEDRREAKEYVLRKAKEAAAFTKILTEDIFC